MGDVKNPPATPTSGETTPAAPAEPLKTPEPAITSAPEPTVEPSAEPAAPAEPTAPAKPGEAPAEPVQEPEKTVPVSVLTTERKKWQSKLKRERQRLANASGSQVPPGTDPETLNEIRQHPYVQDLEMSKAETQLKKGVVQMLKDYPTLPKSTRRAILRNPRGFVIPGTEDVPNGVLDIENYVQEELDSLEAVPGTLGKPTPKAVPVAATNVPATNQPVATPEAVQKIMDKPVDQWTKAERAILKDRGAPEL